MEEKNRGKKTKKKIVLKSFSFLNFEFDDALCDAETGVAHDGGAVVESVGQGCHLTTLKARNR